MSDLISRKAAIEALAEMMPRSYTLDGSHPADEEIFKAQEIYADCIKTIEIMPSEQPDIIRCKDCKYYMGSSACIAEKDIAKCSEIEIYMPSDGYCSYGRRKEKE